MSPRLLGFDHVHVHVRDRDAAEAWYARVLGFIRSSALESFARNGGPLMIQDPAGSVHLALFERSTPQAVTTIALRVTSDSFVDWQAHFARLGDVSVELQDHEIAMSLYLRDPDGNTLEITTYDYAAMKQALKRSIVPATGG